MKRLCLRCLPLVALASALFAAVHAAAGPIYVVSVNGTSGNIYKYDNIADMMAQTPSIITGTLVATVAGYHNDQGVTFDYDSEFVYRIANGGNVFRFASVANWIAGSPSTNVSIGSSPFSNMNNKRVNDVSFDGATGGFYAVGAASNSATPGDILVYDELDDFRAAAHNSTYGDTTYGAARAMFWSREPVAGTTANSQNIFGARYYQISGMGRLEVFKSLATYAAAAGNRINLGPEGAFGGTNTTGFQAVVAFAVPVPEPASFVLCLSAACCLMPIRRR